MNSQLADLIRKGKCILLLGAGASYKSQDIKGRDLLLGEGLSQLLCEEAGVPYEEGKLAKVYAIAKKKLGARLIAILEERFANTNPSRALSRLMAHVWPRVYTLNIDDATEVAIRRSNKSQHLKIRARGDAWADIDGLFKRLNLIKLNGCIHRPDEGFIFSPSEYAAASNNPPEWYRQLGRDYLNYAFIFIGTKLDEPLFYQQIEYYKSAWAGGSGQPGYAYVLTPTISALDRELLAADNITHIAATLEEFVIWLDGEINNTRTAIQVAAERNPELAIVAEDVGDLTKVVKVSANQRTNFDKRSGKTREFYLGFKPTWNEIFDGVPASLQFHRVLEKSVTQSSRVHVVVGPAGSGKTTALMMLAAKLSSTDANVYFLTEPIATLGEVVSKLESVNTRPYFVFVEKASSVLDGLIDVLQDGKIQKAVIVCGERQNVWRHRSEWALSPFRPVVIPVEEITRDDATAILEKLEKYGPWSRVARLTVQQRIDELLQKSKRQLLIGLLELTVGYGFEKIIEDDFKKLDSDDARALVVLVGMATVHGLGMSRDLCLAALSSLGVTRHLDALLKATDGIIHSLDGVMRARHPVYVDKLFDGKISLSLKETAVRALLSSMTRNEKPISKNMSRNEVMLFKYTINHNFLNNFFHGRRELVLTLFADYEKYFELDGLYYLQYGLALRDFDEHGESLRKLESAVAVWAMKQTEHAYAQQLLICALTETKEGAYRNLQMAKEILLRLDARYVEDDTDYPIVTLGEYHIRIAKRFESPKAINDVANHYLSEISNRQKRGRTNNRLDDAKREILKLATGGKK